MNKTKKEDSPIKETADVKDYSSELRRLQWSVISFEKCEAANLTYARAEEKLAELQNQKVSGLCIVTDEAARRI